MSTSRVTAPNSTGRYAIFDEIASGGMATVHLARLVGPVSFSRTVAVKRLHAHLALKPAVVAMFLEEARVAAYVRHTNVVATLDIVNAQGETFLVMEYVHGESVARLLDASRRLSEPVPVPVACAIAVGILHGLNAAHEATGERGEPLGIVHRDVSPQNVMVGVDGVARVVDFGIAQAVGRRHGSREGQAKGKVAYSAPEVVRGRAITRAADVYSAAVVLWETLTGERLFSGDNDANVLQRVLFSEVQGPSKVAGHVPPALDLVLLRALAREPAARFATARDMARAIERVVPIADASEVGEWVERLVGGALAERARRIAGIETGDHEPVEAAASGRSAVLLADQSGDIPAFGSVSGAGDLGPAFDGSQAGSSVRASPLAAPNARRGRARVLLLAAAGAVGVAAIGSVSFDHWRAQAGATTSSSAPVPMPETPPSSDKPAALQSTDTGAAVVVSPAARSSSSAAGVTPAPPPAHELRRRPVIDGASARPTVVHDAATTRTAPAEAARCNPPWTIDSHGIKQYRLECL